MDHAVRLYDVFLAGGFGFLLGMYYDVFRVIRLMMHSSRWAIFFQDLFFFASSAVVTFFFLLTVTGGGMRVYLLIGLLLGFFAYYFTIGRLVIRCARQVLRAILAFWRTFWRLVWAPFRLLLRLLKKLLHRPAAFLAKQARSAGKKICLFFKKALQPARNVLYNQKKDESERDAGS